MSLDDFQILSKLGQGTYSTVYKVFRNKDKQYYALKKVKLLSLSPKEKQNALNQIRILASLDSHQIIKYKQAFFDQHSMSLCLIMEYANEGDLLQKIQKMKKKQQHLDEDQIWNIFISIVKGLKYLHSRKILHRDIKTANIFLHQNGAKLGDLNVSKICQEGLCMTQTGTPYYACPQVWKDQSYNQKSDIWSLGCVLYEMITLKPPFYSDDMEDLYKKVIRGIYAKIPKTFSSQLSTLIRMLLQVNPDSRPSCSKILNLQIVKQRLKQSSISNSPVKNTLLKTIRASQNFMCLNNELPKAKYEYFNNKKRSNRDQKQAFSNTNEIAPSHRKSINTVFENKYKTQKQIKSVEQNQNQKLKSSQQTISLAKTKNNARKKLNQKQNTQIQLLPLLENKERRMTPGQNSQNNNSERLHMEVNKNIINANKQKHQKEAGQQLTYQKYTMNAVINQRKKSLLQLYERGSKKVLESCRSHIKHELNNDILQLKLPKVYGRTRKNSQKTKQAKQKNGKSMRMYKIHE